MSVVRTNPPGEQNMYETPSLERYGTFRELTRIGKNGIMDPASIFNSDSTTNNDGCNTEGSPTGLAHGQSKCHS